MVKECTFYYATVVEKDPEIDHSQAYVGTRHLEPIHEEEREPIGKEPDYCCEEIKRLIKETLLIFVQVGVNNHCVFNRSYSGSSSNSELNFCPFCGAQIVFKEDLKIRAVKHVFTRTIDGYYLEEKSHAD